MIEINILEGIFFFIYGTILGSFFNVLIYRLPEGLSIVSPGSRCPNCKRPVQAHENIPILSWLYLKGKCAGCGLKISIQYPLIELFTGIVSVIIWHILFSPFVTPEKVGWQYISEFYMLLSLLILIPVAIIDIKHYIIPDSITLGGLVLSIAISFLPGYLSPIQSLIGLLVGGGILYAAGLLGELILKKEAMGGGDIKLMAFTGALWGWKIALTSIVVGAFCGAIIGLLLIVIKKSNKDNMLPFGPFLALGIILSVFYSDQLIYWYLNFPQSLIK